jgi:single-strand DNA-binding protein
MSHHAAQTAAQPNSSLRALSVASSSSVERNSACARSTVCRGLVAQRKAAVGANFAAEIERVTPVHWGIFRPDSRPLLGITLRGQSRRPAARRRSASTTSPLRGLGSSQKKFEGSGKERRSNFFRAPPRKHSLALGSRAHSLGFACVTRAGYGKFNETEIYTMYSNKVTLIGFLGNDAEVHTNNDRSLTTLSLATKSSYKKDGKYIEHTEWHRCVAFGKLGEFAATLKKGAHIQVEGELRSRKYESTKTNTEVTVWEIRVNSILKLDRAAKATAEDDEDVTEEEAA